MALDTKMEAEKDALVAGMGFDPDEEFIQNKYGAGWKKKAMSDMGGFDWNSGGMAGTPSGSKPDMPDMPDAPEGQAQQAQPGGETMGAVQDTALNGAQVQSLMQAMEAVAAGRIPKESAINLALAAFPLVAPEKINGMFNPIEVKQPESAAPTQPAPQAKPEVEPVGFAEGENRRRDVTDDLADKLEVAAGDAMDGLLEPIRRLVASATSFTEVIDGLRNLYPDMDTGNFAEVMKDALVASGMAGAASVNVRRSDG